MDAERKTIDEIDSKIIELLAERAELAKKVGNEKKKEGSPVRDRSREGKVRENWKELAIKNRLDPNVVENIADEVMLLSRMKEKREGKIGILGPDGTFTHEAALDYFGEGNEIVALPSIPSVFNAVETGLVDYGVVPSENIIEGSVNITLDSLIDSPLMIYAEEYLPVSQNLIIGEKTKLTEVKTVMSHPQAISQCRQYLEKNFPDVELKSTPSTAKAVELLKEVTNSAAIGTVLAAKLYGGKVVAKDIQDLKENRTRFFVLSKGDHPKTGKDKTSIIFSCKDEPGALFAILREFAGRKINLTKIESRPSKTKSWEYLFFVDFDGHREELNCRMALSTIKSKTTLLKILGSYPKARFR